MTVSVQQSLETLDAILAGMGTMTDEQLEGELLSFFRGLPEGAKRMVRAEMVRMLGQRTPASGLMPRAVCGTS